MNSPGSSKERLPCPFCGRPAHPPLTLSDEGWRVGCSNSVEHCPVLPYVDSSASPDRAVADWNRRAAHEPSTGRWYAADDIDRLVRELDVILNGEDGAAKQAMLCDIVGQMRKRTTAQPPLPDYRAAMKAAECDEGIDCDTFIRVLQKKIADQQRELARLQRPAQPPEAIHKDGKFLRGWLQIDRLPGGMMVSNDGPFGPVPAMSSCFVTTSETTAKEWADRGKPVLEFRLSLTKPASRLLVDPDRPGHEVSICTRCGKPDCECSTQGESGATKESAP